jgi:GMP synthase-like glutamine amidotransferase
MSTIQILQNSRLETPGILSYIFEDEGIPFTVHPVDGWPSLMPSLEGAGGLVILGGPMRVHEQERYPFLKRELRLIESALATGIPILGIGLGSQLLASVLGARVVRGRHPEIGWFPVTLTGAAAQDPLWKGIESPFLAFHWHDEEFDVPMGATRLAYSATTYGQAFRYGQNVYGLQFHLEVTYPILTGMVDACEPELVKAGVEGQSLTDNASQHIFPLHETGRVVFERWAGQVAHPKAVRVPVPAAAPGDPHPPFPA